MYFQILSFQINEKTFTVADIKACKLHVSVLLY